MEASLGWNVGFLQERLAKAEAVPPERRSPEVAAFIDCCRLQEEARQLLEQPPSRSWRVNRQRATLAALKLSHSCALSPLSTALVAIPSVFEAVTLQLGELGVDAGGRRLSQGLTTLLQSDSSLPTLLKVTAVAAVFVKQKGAELQEEAELVPVANDVVRRLRQPTTEREAQIGLAELQAGQTQPTLTFEQLLAYWINFGRNLVGNLVVVGSMSSDMDTAIRNSTELLPQLQPHEPRTHYFAALMELARPGPSYDRHMRSALHMAEQHGSDFWVANCGYMLATAPSRWAGSGEPWAQEECPPSVVLSYMQQAREAHARCTALLPRQWTVVLKRRKETAWQYKPWLEQLAARGDRWEALGPVAEAAAMARGTQLARQSVEQPTSRMVCCGCGMPAAYLRRCAGCKKSAYCSVECQRTDWPKRKAVCRGKRQAS